MILKSLNFLLIPGTVGYTKAVLYLLNSGIPSVENSNTQLQCRGNHRAHGSCWDVKLITIRGCTV